MSLFHVIKGFFRGFQSGLAKGKVSRQAKEASETRTQEVPSTKRTSFKLDGNSFGLEGNTFRNGRFVLVIILVVGGPLRWEALDENGYIPHNKLAVVTFRNWSAGEYKKLQLAKC